mgnify:CR=1 FL=1
MDVVMNAGLEAVLLFGAAIAAGMINAIAGGGGLLVFPALLLSGVSPISANATGAAGIWVGMVISGVAYRAELKSVANRLGPVTLSSLSGGALGAWLLLNFSDEGFSFIVPYLVALGTLLFAISEPLKRKMTSANVMRPPIAEQGDKPKLNQPMLVYPQGLISTYGGFFGGGAGILMLSLLTLTNPGKLQTLQAVKVWMAICINAAALGYFVFVDVINWPYAALVAAGTSSGGYSSAYFANKVSAVWLRHFVIVTGVVLSIYFFLSTY